MKRVLLTALLAGILLVSSTALADDKDERIRALEEKIEILAAEIQKLKQERAAEKEVVAEIDAKAQEAMEMAATRIEPAAGGDAVDVSMKPSPKFTAGNFSFQPFGRIHLDYAFFDDDQTDHPNGAEFRRARLGVKGTVAEDFGYKVEIDFANEGVNFKDVYINYTGIDNTEFRLGSTKPQFSLENMTSSNYITFIERSAPTSAFAVSEIIGLAGYYSGENWSLTGGLFNDDPGTGSNDDEAWYITGRGTFAPINEAERTLHLGVSAGHRKPDQANETFDFDARAENSIQSADSVSANFANAESADIYGFETALVLGPVSAQGEYFAIDVDRDAANSDLDFNGAYGQLAWTLSGERRPYDAGAGKFGRIVPDNPFDPAAGDWGAWELAGRYSMLDVSDDNVQGGEMKNYTLGLNWYLHKHIRLMGNYIIVDTDHQAVTPNDDPRLLLLRGQLDF